MTGQAADRHLAVNACGLRQPGYTRVAPGLFWLATTFSLMLSSHLALRAFGLLSLLSLGLAYYFYTQWFISVWCFFAALLSLAVYGHFAARKAPGIPLFGTAQWLGKGEGRA